MISQQIDKAVGTWSIRQALAGEYALKLSNLLKNIGYRVTGPVAVTLSSLSGDAIALPTSRDVAVQSRAKANVSIIEKMSRFDETLEEMLDLFGLRAIAYNMEQVERISEEICVQFGVEPQESEMTLRSGTLVFPPFRDYRKRDWPGVSPATSSGYNEAIHLNRKMASHIVEIQIMTQPLFNKFVSRDMEESHEKFKIRQAALFASATYEQDESLQTA